MKRILTAVLASLALCVFAVPTMADDMKKAPSAMATGVMKADAKMDAMGAKVTKKKCMATTGMAWTKGYTKKDGTKVDGYCHKTKSMSKM